MKPKSINSTTYKRNSQRSGETILGLGNFNGHITKIYSDGLRVCMAEVALEKKNMEGKMLIEFCDEKRIVCCKYMD